MRAIFALALLLCCLAQILLATNPEEAVQAVKTCAIESGAIFAEMGSIRPGRTSPDDVKENIKCTIQCALAKMGIIDADGKVNPENILQFAPDDTIKAKLQKAVDACANNTVNSCESAYLAFDCFGKNFDLM